MTPTLQIIVGDCREVLATLPAESVQCCVTSPPYFGLRDYGHAGQIGLEATPDAYVAQLVAVFREVRRVLREDGTVWLNLGDSYCSIGGIHSGREDNQDGAGAGERVWREGSARADGELRGDGNSRRNRNGTTAAGLKPKDRNGTTAAGLKPKDLIGIPWRVAFALQSDGWYLRSDIIWSKPNPMPESVTDRPTRAHEYIFLLTKAGRYFYDAAAIREPASSALVRQVEDGYNGHAVKEYLGASVQDASATKSRIIGNARKRIDKQRGHSRRHAGFNDKWDALTPAEQALLGANKRSVWTVAPACYQDAHFATFPPNLIRPCILAGSRAGDTILDPFGGSGTTGAVALETGRSAILCELNPDYAALARTRCNVTPGLAL